MIFILAVLGIVAIYGNYLSSLPNVGSNWNLYGPSSIYTTTAVTTTNQTTTAQNFTNTTAPQQNATIAVTLEQELNNSANAGFNVTALYFRTPYSSNCTRELITSCDNNAPDQFICVNSAYASEISKQYSSIYSSHAYVCPQYILEGTVACTSYQDYCVVTEQK